MNSQRMLTEEEIRELAKRLEVDIEQVLKILLRFTAPNGMSPVIITDGSLVITSIADAISPPSGGPPYSYTMKKLALNRLKHCNDKPIAPTDTSKWNLQITGKAGGANATITIAPSSSTVLTISGVPNNNAGAAPTPSSDTPSGENVLVIDSFVASKASFDPGNGHAVTVGQRHLSLHFSNAD